MLGGGCPPDCSVQPHSMMVLGNTGGNKLHGTSRAAVSSTWVTTDASQTAIAATLTQVDPERNHLPVVFKSCCLMAAEQTYHAHNLELLAVVHALSVWRTTSWGWGHSCGLAT